MTTIPTMQLAKFTPILHTHTHTHIHTSKQIPQSKPCFNEFILYWNQKNGYEPQKPPTLGKTIWERRSMQLLKGNCTYFSHKYACNQLLYYIIVL